MYISPIGVQEETSGILKELTTFSEEKSVCPILEILIMY